MSRRTARAALVSAALVALAAGCTGQDSASNGGASSSESVSDSPASESPSQATDSASPEAPAQVFAGAWRDVTADALGETADWTNKVELADLDVDGDVDLLFANGGDYDKPGTPVASRVFLNAGDGTFTDRTRRVLGGSEGHTRVIKVADLDADGRPDIVLGTTFGTQSRLFLGAPDGWSDVTTTHLPTANLSVGDLEPGDVDRDGDLDLVLADWGQGSPMQNDGGLVRLWLNDGTGHFTAAPARQLPATLVKFSWDLELLDVDNDWDLDVAVSCKMCASSLLFVNDGTGRFTDITDERMPASTNNYEFAPIDLDGDGFLDLVTVNDGESRSAGLAEHIFRNDGSGGFVDVTDEWWEPEANPGYDDNVVVGLDVESDGDADFVIGSLDGPDRLLVNDGSGHLTLEDQVFDADPSRGTLGMALADLDGDGLIDVVEGQGEVPGHEDERVYLGTDVLAPDTAPPVVTGALEDGLVVARVDDHRTPYLATDMKSIVVAWDGGRRPMTWYGERLFSAPVPSGVREAKVCAADRAGNQTCLRVG